MPACRRKGLLDAQWKFHRGEVELPPLLHQWETYLATKAARGRGPAALEYDDTGWPVVDLPHDFVITGEPDPALNSAEGYLPRGVAWYRRAVDLAPSHAGQRMLLQFDGVATHCTVWVNGHLLARNFCGSTSFHVDFTDVARFDCANVIAVRVDADEVEGWYYEGGGIYRHVWLLQCGPVALEPWGVYVHPEQQADGAWRTPVEATVRNVTERPAIIDVYADVLDGQGQVVASAVQPLSVPAGGCATAALCPAVEHPRLWNLDDPQRYTLSCRLAAEGVELDALDVPFGYRTLRYGADGFFLNGQPVKICGTSNHQDFGPLGVALPDRVQAFRIRRLKDMGCNAYRCAHNPPAPELLDACDRLGMLVLDENRWFESSEEALRQVEAMVLRDRNHPSVFAWSVGNEEPLQSEPQGRRIMARQIARIRALDGARPITLALCGGWLDRQTSDLSDIIGINYYLPYYDYIHAQQPEKLLLGTETCAAGSSRGHYAHQPELGLPSAYDLHFGPFSASRRTVWRHLCQRPYAGGEFVWAGIDYRGEAQWPGLFSNSGSLDPCCYPKDNFYLNRAQWTDAPMVHLLPHWNWPGDEGQVKDVWAYTNCEEVELFLNGVSLGRQQPEPCEHGRWAVPYEPGELLAVAYRDGCEAARSAVRTTGAPVSLALRLEDEAPLVADGQDVALLTCYCLDAQGRPVPDAEVEVAFQADGRSLRTFGASNDPVPVTSPTRRLFSGLAMAVVQPLGAGALTVTASSPGLRSARLTLSVLPSTRDSLPPACYVWGLRDWWMTSLLTPEKPPLYDLDFSGLPQRVQQQNCWVAERLKGAPPTAYSCQTGWGYFRYDGATPPAALPDGLQLTFDCIRGRAEVWVDTASAALTRPTAHAQKDAPEAGSLTLALPGYGPNEPFVVLVLLEVTGPDCGIIGKVHW